MCHNKYLKKAEVYRPTWEDRVYDPRGVVITHVVVSYNRSLQEMQSRGRFFHPRCEFVHGKPPIIRKYPDVRISIWGDTVLLPNAEWWGRPPGVPMEDTQEYSALCFICHKRHDLSMCCLDHCYIWSIKACRHCFRLRCFSKFDEVVFEIIISFLGQKCKAKSVVEIA